MTNPRKQIALTRHFVYGNAFCFSMPDENTQAELKTLRTLNQIDIDTKCKWFMWKFHSSKVFNDMQVYPRSYRGIFKSKPLAFGFCFKGNQSPVCHEVFRFQFNQIYS